MAEFVTVKDGSISDPETTNRIDRSMPMEGKRWFRSRMMWIQAATIAAGVLDQLSTSPIIPPEAIGGIMIALGTVNGFLRAITKQPLRA